MVGNISTLVKTGLLLRFGGVNSFHSLEETRSEELSFLNFKAPSGTMTSTSSTFSAATSKRSTTYRDGTWEKDDLLKQESVTVLRAKWALAPSNLSIAHHLKSHVRTSVIIIVLCILRSPRRGEFRISVVGCETRIKRVGSSMAGIGTVQRLDFERKALSQLEIQLQKKYEDISQWLTG